MNVRNHWLQSQGGVLGAYLFSYAVLWLVRVFEIGRLEHLVLPPSWWSYSELFWLVICGGVPLLTLYVMTPYPYLSFRYSWRKPMLSPWFWRYLFVTVMYIFMVNVILFRTGQSIWRLPSLSGVMWIKFIVTILIEESAFRGVIYHGLIRIGNEWIAMMVNSILFVLWHAPSWYLQGISWSLLSEYAFALCVFSILLTNLTRYSKSLYPAIACHFLYNLSFLL